MECAKTGALVAFEQLNASLPCLAASDCVAAYPPEETRKFLDEQQLRQLAKLRMEADIASVEGLAACPFVLSLSPSLLQQLIPLLQTLPVRRNHERPNCYNSRMSQPCSSLPSLPSSLTLPSSPATRSPAYPARTRRTLLSPARRPTPLRCTSSRKR